MKKLTYLLMIVVTHLYSCGYTKNGNSKSMFRTSRSDLKSPLLTNSSSIKRYSNPTDDLEEEEEKYPNDDNQDIILNIDSNNQQSKPIPKQKSRKNSELKFPEEDDEKWEKPIKSSLPLEDKIKAYIQFNRNNKNHWEDELASIYIPAQGSHLYRSEATFDLKKQMYNYLENSNYKVIALLGDTGAGKTTFTKELQDNLLYHWKNTSDYLPIWINLPSLSKEEYTESAVETTLLNYGFTEYDIKELIAKYKFLLILDGYDELLKHFNIIDSNNLENWKGKVIVVSRIQHFNRVDIDPYLAPLDDQEQPIYRQLCKIYLSPFSKKSREVYIDEYLKNNKSPWDTKKYLETIENNVDLDDLIDTPLLLKMVVKVLPSLMENNESKEEKSYNDDEEKNTNFTNKYIGINKIYEAFLQDWIKRETKKLNKEGKEKEADKFISSLAYEMTEKGLSTIKTSTKKTSEENDLIYKKYFKPKENQWKIHATPLKYISPSTNQEEKGRWSFLHKSLQDYYATRIDKDEFDNYKPSSQPTKLEKLIKKLNSRPDSPDLTKFRSDSIKEDEDYKKKLYEILELSKTDKSVSQAAANAITALNFAKESFSNMNFENINIPGADLRDANLLNTILRNANLDNINFKDAFLYNTNLENSFMNNINLGQESFFKFNTYIKHILLSNDKKSLAVIAEDLWLWDIKSKKLIKKLIGATSKSKDISFNTLDSKLFSITEDCKLYIWDFNDEKKIDRIWLDFYVDYIKPTVYDINVLKTKIYNIEKLCAKFNPQTGIQNISDTDYFTNLFSENNLSLSKNSIYIACDDLNYIIWVYNIHKESIIAYKGNNSKITGLQFSPNNDKIMSKSIDKTIKIWNLNNNEKIIFDIKNNFYYDIIGFSSNGNSIFATYNDEISIWNLLNKERVFNKRFDFKMSSICLFNTDKLIAIGNIWGEIFIIDIYNGNILNLIKASTSNIQNIQNSTNDSTLLCHSENFVKFYDINNIAIIKKKLFEKINTICFSEKRGELFLGNMIGNLITLDLNENIKKVVNFCNSSISHIAIADNEDLLAMADETNLVFLFNLITESKEIINQHDYKIKNLIFSPNNNKLGYIEIYKIHIIDIKNKQKQIIIGHNPEHDDLETKEILDPYLKLALSEIEQFIFFNDSNKIVWCESYGYINIYDLNDGQKQTLFIDSNVKFLKIKLYDNDSKLIGYSDRNKVYEYDFKKNKCINKYSALEYYRVTSKKTVKLFHFSPFSEKIGFTVDSNFYICNLKDIKYLYTNPDKLDLFYKVMNTETILNKIQFIIFLKCNPKIILADADTITIWDIEKGSLLKILGYKRPNIYNANFRNSSGLEIEQKKYIIQNKGLIENDLKIRSLLADGENFQQNEKFRKIQNKIQFFCMTLICYIIIFLIIYFSYIK